MDPQASTFTPTAKQRQQLIAIGVEAGTINNDAHPRISVVGTTVGRVSKHRMSALLGFNVSNPREPEFLSPSDRVWIVWMRGSFDEFGTPVMIDLVDDRTMRDLGGSFGQPGDSSDPNQLSDLGVVVELR